MVAVSFQGRRVGVLHARLDRVLESLEDRPDDRPRALGSREQVRARGIEVPRLVAFLARAVGQLVKRLAPLDGRSEKRVPVEADRHEDLGQHVEPLRGGAVPKRSRQLRLGLDLAFGRKHLRTVEVREQRAGADADGQRADPPRQRVEPDLGELLPRVAVVLVVEAVEVLEVQVRAVVLPQIVEDRVAAQKAIVARRNVRREVDHVVLVGDEVRVVAQVQPLGHVLIVLVRHRPSVVAVLLVVDEVEIELPLGRARERVSVLEPLLDAAFFVDVRVKRRIHVVADGPEERHAEMIAVVARPSEPGRQKTRLPRDLRRHNAERHVGHRQPRRVDATAPHQRVAVQRHVDLVGLDEPVGLVVAAVAGRIPAVGDEKVVGADLLDLLATQVVVHLAHAGHEIALHDHAALRVEVDVNRGRADLAFAVAQRNVAVGRQRQLLHVHQKPLRAQEHLALAALDAALGAIRVAVGVVRDLVRRQDDGFVAAEESIEVGGLRRGPGRRDRQDDRDENRYGRGVRRARRAADHASGPRTASRMAPTRYSDPVTTTVPVFPASRRASPSASNGSGTA